MAANYSYVQSIPKLKGRENYDERCFIVMASIFWDSEGILLIDYLECGTTITDQYYAALIPKLKNAIKEKRRGKLRRGVLFHHDNAPAHRSAVAMAAIQQVGFELVDHPPYSPDLAPSDFYLFPKLKKYLRGNRKEDDNEVMDAVESFLQDQDKTFFLNRLKLWKSAGLGV